MNSASTEDVSCSWCDIGTVHLRGDMVCARNSFMAKAISSIVRTILPQAAGRGRQKYSFRSRTIQSRQAEILLRLADSARTPLEIETRRRKCLAIIVPLVKKRGGTPYELSYPLSSFALPGMFPSSGAPVRTRFRAPASPSPVLWPSGAIPVDVAEIGP